MGQHFSLVASDNFKLGAYRAEPSGTPKGGIVVVQEIFGVNHHIRAVCDRFAAEGYAAVAPAVFDRQHPNFESGYSPDEIANARKFVASPDWGAMMKDVQAAIDDAKKSGPTAIIGYCLGGSLAFLAAAKLERPVGGARLLRRPDRQACRREAEGADAAAFRRKDASIPMSDVERSNKSAAAIARSTSIRAHSTAFIATSAAATTRHAAKLAWERSLTFLQQQLKK